MQKTQLEKNFMMYPTVVGQHQPIHIVPQTAMPYQLELFNLNGQKVTTINSEGATNFTAALERGVYLYQIKSEGRQFSGKIIVE